MTGKLGARSWQETYVRDMKTGKLSAQGIPGCFVDCGQQRTGCNNLCDCSAPTLSSPDPGECKDNKKPNEPLFHGLHVVRSALTCFRELMDRILWETSLKKRKSPRQLAIL